MSDASEPETTPVIGSAYLDVSVELIAEILKGLLAPGGRARRFEVSENWLPKDTKIEDITLVENRRNLRLLLKSQHFDSDYRQLPPPLLRTIYE